MAKTTAPLLGLGASGQLGKTIVYASWKGRKYARQHVVPANPDTAAQKKVRGAFSFLQATYKLMPSTTLLGWTTYAIGKVALPRNLWTATNIVIIRNLTTLTGLIFNPGAGSGLPPLTCVFTGTSGGCTVAVTTPTPPTGWSIISAVTSALLQQDSHAATNWNIHEAVSVATPWQPTLTGLPAGTYVVGYSLEWQKPNGDVAFSKSFTGTFVAT